jgi:hypothetical protein
MKAFRLEARNANKPMAISIANKNSTNLLGQTYSKELNIYCDFESSDQWDAIMTCSGSVNELLDQFALAVGAPVSDARIEKVYDITPNAATREIWQFFYSPIEKVGSQISPPDLLEKLIFGFFKGRKAEILRSVHWFRLSLREVEPLDRFTYLWIGLESLNPNGKYRGVRSVATKLRHLKELHP